MRRFLLGLALLIVALLAVATIISLAYVDRVYLAELPKVDQILDSLPPTEANPSDSFRRVALALDSESYEYWVTSSLISRFGPQRKMLDWHVRNFVWGHLLPRRLPRKS